MWRAGSGTAAYPRRVTLRRSTGAAGPLAAVLAAGLLAGCGGGDAAGIEVGTPTRATVVETVDAPATVQPRAQGSVTATADGTVAELKVADGAQVKAGQVLLRLTSPTATRQLREAKAADAKAPCLRPPR